MHFFGAVEFCKLHGPLSPILVSQIFLHVPISYFQVRKSTRATEEVHNLQKQQVLKDTPGGTSPITNPEVD